MTDPLPIDDGELDALLATIFDHYHYDFRGYARASLRRRVGNAVSQLRTGSVPALREQIIGDARAFGQLLPWFTVQVSDLFRDPSFFLRFRTEVVPMLRTYPSRKLWVAGCSTGEEAYSFAIILAEEGLLERTRIYATDIYEPSLQTARAGVYELDRMRTFTENHRLAGGTQSLSQYYATGPTGAVFERSLRDHITFADHSLATDAVFAECEVVSCRNVLIYFAADLQNHALGLFDEALVRGGWLGLGPKETIDFSPLKGGYHHTGERWYRKREGRL